MNDKSESDFRIVTLRIDGVSVDKLSLSDIGAYLEDFADLLGEEVYPRYHSIKRGSLVLRARVPANKEIDVKTRGFLLRTGEAPEDAIRARARMSKRLGVNRASRAALMYSSHTKIIEIPVERPVTDAPQIVPGLVRSGSLQGKIIRVGGRQDMVSVEIQDVDGHVYLCKSNKDLAKKLAREMFDPTIRIHGAGKWTRGMDGVWRVEDFLIGGFEILDDDTLAEALEQIRQIPSSWKSLEEPDVELQKIRNGR